MLTEREKKTIQYYDQNAKAWAEKRKKSSEPSFWHEELIQLKALKKPQGKVLELGSGTGRESFELCSMGYEYAGIDASQSLMRIAQKNYPLISFIYGTPYSLPFAKDSFEAFFSWAMLPHVPKERIREALYELKRVLKECAVGFIAMREGIGEKEEPQTGRWFSYYSQEEMADILRLLGFTIEKSSKKQSRADLVWLTFLVKIE